MSRPRLALSLTFSGCIAMAAAACSGAGATPTPALPSLGLPTVSIPAIPTVSIPVVPSDLPSISIPPIGSGGIPSFAIPTFHQAADLEAQLPSQIRGVTLEKSSFTGDLFLKGSSSGDADLQAVLAQFGKQASDLVIATVRDPTHSVDFTLVAFRLSGVDGNQLIQAVLSAGAAKGSPQPSWRGMP